MAGLVLVLKDAFLTHAQARLETSLQCYSAAQWFAERHLEGIAGKFKAAADAELAQFKALVDYITLRGEPLKLLNPDIGSQEWTDELQVFEHFCELQKTHYEALCKLFNLARAQDDVDAEHFLHSMVERQVQSIDEWEGYVEQTKSFTAMPGLIWHLDAIIK